MQKAHDASKNNYWKNKPDITTPIIAEQLNRMETSMDVIDDRVVLFDSTKANQSDLLTCVASITFNTSTGILTITLKNGTSSTIDTGLAKLAINFDYDDDPTSAHYQQIIMEMKDGTYKYIDLSALITQYEFTNTSTIAFTVASDGTISANVVDGSITANKLQPNYLADVTAQANAAAASAEAAEDSAEDAEAWAEGTINGQPLPSSDPRYHHDAKYWAGQAEAIAGGGVITFNGRHGSVMPTAGDYSDTQISRGQGTVKQSLDKLEDYNDFSVLANAWVANTDTNTNDRFPYIAVITTSIYASTDTPTWGMYGANGIPTDDENDSINMIEWADFGADNGTKIVLYATDQPTEALTLGVKGH